MKDLLDEIGVREVVLGQKLNHKGLLYKGLQSKITIPCGPLFAVRIISKDDKFCLIEIVSRGIDNPMTFEVYNRPKVIQEVKVKTESKQQSLSEEGLFN